MIIQALFLLPFSRMRGPKEVTSQALVLKRTPEKLANQAGAYIADVANAQALGIPHARRYAAKLSRYDAQVPERS
jgi:hypothetical protein